jgi:hypothetical protein
MLIRNKKERWWLILHRAVTNGIGRPSSPAAGRGGKQHKGLDPLALRASDGRTSTLWLAGEGPHRRLQFPTRRAPAVAGVKSAAGSTGGDAGKTLTSCAHAFLTRRSSPPPAAPASLASPRHFLYQLCGGDGTKRSDRGKTEQANRFSTERWQCL